MRKAEEPIEAARRVVLPHDAMIHEKRQANAKGGSAHGIYRSVNLLVGNPTHIKYRGG